MKFQIVKQYGSKVEDVYDLKEIDSELHFLVYSNTGGSWSGDFKWQWLKADEYKPYIPEVKLEVNINTSNQVDKNSIHKIFDRLKTKVKKMSI